MHGNSLRFVHRRRGPDRRRAGCYGLSWRPHDHGGASSSEAVRGERSACAREPRVRRARARRVWPVGARAAGADGLSGPASGAASSHVGGARRACGCTRGRSAGRRERGRGRRVGGRVRRYRSERTDRVQAGPRALRRVGRRLDVRHGLGSARGRRRRRLPAVRHRGPLDVQRLDELGLGLRLRLGLGTVPLRSLGHAARPRLGVDPRAHLRGRVGRLAHGPRRLRVRRLGSGSARMVLVERRRGRLELRLVPPALRLLLAFVHLPAGLRDVRRPLRPDLRAYPRAHASVLAASGARRREPRRRWRSEPGDRESVGGWSHDREPARRWPAARRDRDEVSDRAASVRECRAREGGGVRVSEDGDRAGRCRSDPDAPARERGDARQPVAGAGRRAARGSEPLVLRRAHAVVARDRSGRACAPGPGRRAFGAAPAPRVP